MYHSTERRRYLRMHIFYIKDKLSKGAWGIQHSTVYHCWISLLISNFKQITRRNFCKYYIYKFALSANFLKGIQVDTVKIMSEWVRNTSVELISRQRFTNWTNSFQEYPQTFRDELHDILTIVFSLDRYLRKDAALPIS